MAPVLHGNDGYFMVGSDVVGELNHISCTINAADIDVSVFQGDGWGAHTTGLLTWTATAAGFWDMSDTGQAALWSAMTGNSAVDVYMHLDDDNYYYGSANITSIAIDDTVAGVATCTFNLTGAGKLTQVTS